jgi:hypothetical protein
MNKYKHPLIEIIKKMKEEDIDKAISNSREYIRKNRITRSTIVHKGLYLLVARKLELIQKRQNKNKKKKGK